MELINPFKSPTLTFFSQNISLQKSCIIKPSSSSNHHSTFHPPFLTPSRFRFYAHFRQPTKRQNYLRKKLIEQQRVSKKPVIYNNPTLSTVSDEKFDNVIEKKMSNDNDSVIEKLETKKKLLGDSVLWDELDSWVEQNKKDVEFWGIGTLPIFTVYQDSEGKVETVEVNEDEILRRSGIDEQSATMLYSSKISYAKDIAKQMESGNSLLPSNSSVAKFVVSGTKSGFVNVIQGVTRSPGLFPKMSRLGVAVLVGVFVVWAVKKLFKVEDDSEEYTMLEKEMLRRKLNARAEREKIVMDDDRVEVLQVSTELDDAPVERPKLDREELMKNIIKAKGSNNELAIEEHSGNKKKATKSEEFNDKIQEIRTMARHAREIENRDASAGNNIEIEEVQSENLFSNNKNEVVQQPTKGYINSQVNFPDGNSTHIKYETLTTISMSSDDMLKKSSGTQIHKTSNASSQTQSSIEDLGFSNEKLLTCRASEVDQKQSDSQASEPSLRSLKTGIRVIRSVNDAREYLSRKHEKRNVDLEHEARNAELNDVRSERKTAQKVDRIEKVFDKSILKPMTNSSGNTTSKEEEHILANKGNEEDVRGDRISEDGNSTQLLSHEGSDDTQTNKMPTDGNSSQEKNTTLIVCEDLELEKESSFPENKICCENNEEEKELIDRPIPDPSVGQEMNGRCEELDQPSPGAEKWLEKNFHELEPIIKKMGVSIRDNYMAAKEKIVQDSNSKPEMIKLNINGDDSELDWMKDEKLRDVVFKVRDNELAGRDPFHLMDDGDKLAFFSGLEKKVEQENNKLSNLHVWLHSNIENLDYGADGISVYDPPEKIIPRWKGPPIDQISEFLNGSAAPKNVALEENDDTVKPMGQDLVQNQKESPAHDIMPSTSGAPDEISKFSKTIIQGSDGSIRPGKNKGKEFWQHTKKWSQGFMDCYNAETDPEIKGVMKDMGKDLDRWITEKEIKEAAELMDKLPEKGKKFIKEKLDKVRREVELFGPQAVVSKYREYGDEKEEDYLWWLDLPYVMCIELYTEQEGEQRVGLYSLEMAPDLELSPKPYHVIAFEDAGDCKSLCYIINHHMEMLGNGNAFVIARTPKEVFREAKENGFSVTVIKKGEMQLNVDQTLEEVDELITEIGSKVYHDSIMRERNVDIRALMKGVFGLKKPTRRRRSKRKLRKPTKP